MKKDKKKINSDKDQSLSTTGSVESSAEPAKVSDSNENSILLSRVFSLGDVLHESKSKISTLESETKTLKGLLEAQAELIKKLEAQAELIKKLEKDLSNLISKHEDYVSRSEKKQTQLEIELSKERKAREKGSIENKELLASAKFNLQKELRASCSEIKSIEQIHQNRLTKIESKQEDIIKGFNQHKHNHQNQKSGDLPVTYISSPRPKL